MIQQKYAIIGLGCRFPGSANNPQEFFNNLFNSKDCVSAVPSYRWNTKYYSDIEKSKPGKIITNRGGFMDNLFDFDAEAFQMSVKEASNIDPQQKILLETTLQALEDANIRYRGTKAGVFIGTGQADFCSFSINNPYYVNDYTATGSALSIHSNRLSYVFDLRGPSISIDTACSSSATAMHLALDSIEKGHSQYAIVGGINMLLNPNQTVAFSKLGVLSPEGVCRSFDAKASGYVRSEGCGVVVVKKLEEALLDNNHIYCVISATTANQDGAQSPSLTMPSAEAQSLVMKQAIKMSGVQTCDIIYAEAHATGTKVGDPTEVNTIGSIVGVERRVGEKLRIGSVKSNVGHCECSSYMASLIKVALMIDNKTLVPSINFDEPNPKIRFEEYNLQVQQKVERFDPTGKAFLISSFGFGGANACSIIEASPVSASSKSVWKLQSKWLPYMVSARTKEAVLKKIENLQQLDAAVYNNDEFAIAHTLNSSYHESNRFLSIAIGENITLKTAKFSEPQRISDEKRPLCFVFSGQGPQNIKMGRQLFQQFPIFRAVIEKCDKLYKEKTGISMIHDIGMFGGKIASDPKIVDNIQYTLPSLVFIQIGLYELWSSFGLKPDVLIGHSFGEMCVLYACGAFSLEVIIDSVAARANLMRNFDNKGTMIALGCGQIEAENLIQNSKVEDVWIAAVNSPQSSTLGGTVEAVKQIAEKCKELNIFHRVLNVTNAYHTPLLSCLKTEALEAFEHTIHNEESYPKVCTISTVTGEIWKKSFGKEYFWLNIENAVLFEKAMNTAMTEFGSNTVFLEMAPHPVLSMSMKQCGAEYKVYSLHRNEDEDFSILRACTQLVAYGFPLNWDQIIGACPKVNYLPSYPFQRRPCYFESEFSKESRLVSDFKPLLGHALITSKKIYQNFINTSAFSWLADHVVQEATIFPAAGYIEMALEAFGCAVDDVVISSAMVVPTDSTFEIVQSKVNMEKGKIEIYSKMENSTSWTSHASARRASSSVFEVSEQIDLQARLADVKHRYTEEPKPYKRFEVMNLFYGHYFQCINSLYQGDEEAYAFLKTNHLSDLNTFVLHPSVLDCCFQSFLGALKSCSNTYLPTSCKRIQVYNSIPSELHVFCVIDQMLDNTITGTILGYNSSGKLVLAVHGFTCTMVPNPESDNSTLYTPVFQDKSFPQVVLQSNTCNAEAEKLKMVSKLSPKLEAVIGSFARKIVDAEASVKVSETQLEYYNWCKSLPVSTDVSIEELESTDNIALELQMIKTIGSSLPSILSGENKSISKDIQLLNLYSNSVIYKWAIAVTASLLRNISNLESTRCIRVLELGADQCVLAPVLLPILKEKFNGRVEYLFTDSTIASATQRKFRDYTFVSYKTLNLENDFTTQGLDLCSIDIALCFDISHKSSTIHDTLSYLRNAMVPNGILLLLEQTSPNVCLDFIHGSFRKVNILEKPLWSQTLEKSGFENITTFEHPSSPVSVIVGKNLFSFKDLQYKQESNDNIVVFEGEEVKDLMALTKSLLQTNNMYPLIVVTTDAQIQPTQPKHAALIGFARVFANEDSNRVVKIVDFDSTMPIAQRREWIHKIQSNLSYFESEFAIRDSSIFVPRLVKAPNASLLKVDHAKPYRLESNTPGLVDALVFREYYIPNPLPDHHVFVRVKAAPLNFKDVMLALNMLNLKDTYLGLEFSGVVEQVGPFVTKFKVGDPVYGFAKHCLASHVVASEYTICRKASNLSFVEAASIPAVFLTAYMALIHKAQIQQDDKVLIHSAAGGVGQAAIQLVNWKKATVFATVGSEAKKEFLMKKYGVNHFADSHTADWDQQIRRQAPEGVNVVLNSLSGENIEKGLQLLAPYGSFVEIGKRDILDNTNVGLLPFLQNLSYFSVHLDLLTDQRPKVVGKYLEELNSLLENNTIHAIVDAVYAAKDIKDAFRFMQTGKHMGKIVISFENSAYLPDDIYGPSKLFNSQMTYILSGGLGAVGFEIAKWMIKEEDAKYLVLLSRNPKLSKYQKREIELLQKEKAATVLIIKADVTETEHVDKVLSEIKAKNLPAVGGIFNLAMVLEDETIMKLTDDSLDRVMKPKIDGSTNLLKSFGPSDLDFVFFFSSISAIIGNQSQANYCAANAFLDAYARKLANEGYKARVLNLGAVDDVGVIATDYQLRKSMAGRGLGTTITAKQVCQTVKQILQGSVVQQVSKFPFENMYSQCPTVKSKISHLIEHEQADEEDGSSADNVTASIELLTAQIAKLLLIEASAIDPAEKLTSYGVDSLLAVEIGALIKKTLKLKISQMEILGGITLNQLRSKLEH